MKRTFGRIMSLLLVLAMVLAMVPAALAANQAYSVEPNSTIKIKTSIIKEGSVSWSSSDTSVAKVEGSTTEATVTGVKASNTAVRITATGKVNGRDYSEYFTVYVRDAYTLTLALSNSNINGTVALNQGDTRTLTATVTVGSSGGVTAGNLANCEVHFTSDSDAISVSPDSAKVTASTVGNYTTYKVEATVKAEKVGGATLTAQVYYKSDKGMKPSTSATATKTIGFRVSGAATISVTLPTAQQVLSLEAGGTSATLQPKVTGYSGTAQPKLLYLYDSEDNSLYVRPNTATTSATVEPYKACDATNIYICIASYNAGKTYKDAEEGKLVGSYAVCTVSIKNKGMSVTALEVMNSESVTYNGKTSRLQTLLDNGTMVFGLQDSYYKPAVKSSMIRSTLEVTARIKAPDSLLNSETDRRNAYSRIEWTSSAPAVAKVKTTSSDDQKAVATIEAVAPGTATITAKVDGNVTATYAVTVYQGRAYKITEEPSIGETVGKMTQTELEALFKKESAKVEIQTSIYSDEVMIYELPVKTATATGSDAAGYTFTYTLDGLKTSTKEFFYNRNDPSDSGVTTTDKVTFSDISFPEQPVTAAYKITDTIADLAMTASVSTSTIKSVVWYMNSDQTTGGVDKAIQTDKVTGTPTNYRSVLSNLKQYITGTGTYVFYCRVTTDNGKYAETRKAIITITGENHINITFNPTAVKAGETFTITGVPQEYVNGKLTNVTGKTYTITWTSSDENIVKLSSKISTNSSPSVTATAKAGGQVTIKAETTIGAKKYAAEKTIFVTVPELPSASITIVPVCGKAGEKVRVPVILENNPGFADLSIEIDYDSAVVELTDVQPNNEVGGNFTPAQNYTVRPYVLNWVNDENNNLFNGVLAILTFTIKQDAPLGSYPITVDYYRGITGNNIDGEDVNYDKDWNRVPLNYISGKLIVCAYTPGDINGDGEVDINDAICLLKYVAGWKLDGVVIEAPDVNGDGRVNTKDAIQILRYIAGRNVTLY
mgnify:CR=1 FL=1